MAKQVGPVFFTGTIDGLIFYKLGDRYYTRSKGSYKSAKHMRRNPKYKRTMQKADQFGDASKLTQEVYYRYLPKAVRKHGLFGKLTGLVNSWLQEGKSRGDVIEHLIAHCQTLAPTAVAQAPLTTAVSVPVVQTQSELCAETIPSKSLLKKSTTPSVRVKQARYLSSWKVKHNGRLQIPKPTVSVPTVTPFGCYAELVSASAPEPNQRGCLE